MWLGADQKSAFTWWENVRLNLWQVEKTLKGHWKTTKGIYSHFYWILRCWLLRKLNSAIGKIRAIFGAPITPLLQCPTMCKGCGWLICTGHWLQKVGSANCASSLKQKITICLQMYWHSTYNTPSPKNEVCCHERHALSKYVSSLSKYLYKWCQVRLHCRNARLLKPCVLLSIVQCKKPLPVYSFGVSLLKTREFCIERYLDCVIMLSRHVIGLEALLHSHYIISGLF